LDAPGSLRKDHLKILVVDDTPANLLALEAALAGIDAELVQAASGFEALRHALAGDFAAIILDVSMPELDGFETAALIRSRKRSEHTPIIFMTAYRDEASLLRGYDLGAVDYLFKPVAPEIIRSKVNVFIDLARKAAILERLAEEVRQLNAGLEDEVQKRTAELRRAQIAAQEADAAKSRFLANMSHELRTPLNAVIGYSEMLEEEAHDCGAANLIPDVRKIRSAGTHLLRLINDVLDLSRIEAGKMTASIGTFDVRAMIEDVVNTARPLMEKNRNELTVDSPGAEFLITSDQTKVSQCLLNLLSNAAKFTHDGKVRLSVDCNESSITFVVADTGDGMTAAQVERLFEPFTQVHAGGEKGGTGLGLAITRRLCTLLGGEVSVKSEPGKGSTFVISLPLAIPEINTGQFELAARF
jgi:signal transduction histidine kinase